MPGALVVRGGAAHGGQGSCRGPGVGRGGFGLSFTGSSWYHEKAFLKNPCLQHGLHTPSGTSW